MLCNRASQTLQACAMWTGCTTVLMKFSSINVNYIAILVIYLHTWSTDLLLQLGCVATWLVACWSP